MEMKNFTTDELRGMIAEGCQGHAEANAALAKLARRAADMLAALQAIEWKLARKESASGDGTDCRWATIDCRDSVMIAARAAIEKAQP